MIVCWEEYNIRKSYAPRLGVMGQWVERLTTVVVVSHSVSGFYSCARCRLQIATLVSIKAPNQNSDLKPPATRPFELYETPKLTCRIFINRNNQISYRFVIRISEADVNRRIYDERNGCSCAFSCCLGGKNIYRGKKKGFFFKLFIFFFNS